MSEMVKRLAEAILTCGHSCDDEDGHLALARIALREIRVPTNKMVCAVLDAHDKASRATRVIEDWQTMIDAALEED
jgi:hypothetical protein